MIARFVIGTGFGDEGKGRTVSYLCSKHPKSLVVRFNGGSQAGHTVVHGTKRHVFSNFGSGTLQGIPTYLGPRCAINPLNLFNEAQTLHLPIIYIDPDCRIITPYDVLANQTDTKNIQHGTCGAGFGKALKREEAGYTLRWRDLLYPRVMNEKMNLIKEWYGTIVPLKHILEWEDAAAMMVPRVRCFLDPTEYEDIIFEGAQGILLDQQYGFFPHVTPSNCTSQNAVEILEGWGIQCETYWYYVTRTYQTRHGNGPISNRMFFDFIDQTNKDNRFQGEFKRGYLDLGLLSYALFCDDKWTAVQKYLVFTQTDVFSCTSWYNVNGILHKQDIPGYEDITDFLELDGYYTSFGPETTQIKKGGLWE